MFFIFHSMEENKILSPFDCFAASQETYEEAVKKSDEESRGFNKVKRFAMDSMGKYSVRILPIAPVQKEDGSWSLDRKGYEYPIKTLVLKLDNPNSKSKKDKFFYVNVVQAGYVGLSVDLIDTYVNVAQDKYGDDEKLIKKITGNSFDGGLKWNSQRCMYVYDFNKRGDGIQLLQLSYAQYKDLEERKLDLWKMLLTKFPKHPCPISSINKAFPVGITRKEDKGKTTYLFSIDNVLGYDELSEDEMNALLSAPRLPETIYNYRRFHLEATIEFLKQYDAKMEIDVMGSKEIADAIEKIKMELPADDKSHFSFDKKDRKNDNDDADSNDDGSIDSLWDRWEKLEERGIGDKSEEGQELRDDIRNFIDENNLSVRVLRSKTNEDLLKAIEDALERAKGETPASEPSDDDEEDDAKDDEPEAEETEEETPASEPEEEANEEEEEEERPRRGEHNDDTNEPAVTPRHERRSARPARRVR